MGLQPSSRNAIQLKLVLIPILNFYARLKANFTITQAEMSITSNANGWWFNEIAGTRFIGQRLDLKVIALKEAIQGDNTKTLWLLFIGAFGMVLISVCNVSNLFVARVAENQKQMAIQAAVGAKKSDLFKSLLADSSLIMVMSVSFALWFQILVFIFYGHYYKMSFLGYRSFR